MFYLGIQPLLSRSKWTAQNGEERSKVRFRPTLFQLVGIQHDKTLLNSSSLGVSRCDSVTVKGFNQRPCSHWPSYFLHCHLWNSHGHNSQTPCSLNCPPTHTWCFLIGLFHNLIWFWFKSLLFILLCSFLLGNVISGIFRNQNTTQEANKIYIFHYIFSIFWNDKNTKHQ